MTQHPTKSPLTAQTRWRSTKSASSALPSRLIKAVSKSSTSNRCGSRQTVPFVTFSTVLFSENLLLLKTSRASCQDGLNQLLLVVMHTVTSTAARTTSLPSQAKLSSSSLPLTDHQQLPNSFTNSKVLMMRAASLVCSTLTSLFDLSRNPASLMLWTGKCLSSCPPKIQF